MKRIIKVSKFISVLSLFGIAFIACDNDYNSLESDIQGTQNFDTNSDKFAVAAYNKRIKPVQSNNLSSHFMGIYIDDIYGETISNIITQTVPANTYYNPVFGDNPKVESVYLTIPYYSTVRQVNENATLYNLDSLYGSNPIKLSIYRSNYYLRDYNPNSNDVDPQIYYTNNSEFDINTQADLLYENLSFIPNDAEIPVEEEDEDGVMQVVDRLKPSLHVELLNTNEFWDNLLFSKEGKPELSNANNFTEYFRGLYFKSESTFPGYANSIMLDFLSSAANVTVNYSNDGEGGARVNKKFVMNFKGNRASTITVNPITNALLNNANNNADLINGDETLYLKGAEGAIAVVNLFNNPTVLDEFNLLYKDANGKPSRLINEANLIFYVDQTKTSNLTKDQDPQRVILYDMKNNVPIVDYLFDLTTNTTNPGLSKLEHSSPLQRDSNGKGLKYKLRITEHLNNILLRDSTNFKLGLYLTANINEIDNAIILNEDSLEGIPVGTVITQKGTVLHGSSLNVPENKRVQL
ncbi:MAG: DUF4270 domain-containing protein, partial [Xanthomarina sp.]